MSDRPAETEYSALQALLQIRSNNSNSSSQGESRVPAESEGSNNEAAPNSVTQAAAAHGVAAPNTNANISNFLRMSASPASILQQAQLSYTSGQLAAAAASLQSGSPGSHFGRSSLLSAVLQNPAYASTSGTSNPFLNAVARGPSLAAGVSSSMDMPQRSAALSPIRPAGLDLSTGAAPTAVVQEAHNPSMQTESEKIIRQGEVEAALRSKPQRGRKRENLNAEERLELTRTRNREHAKSTR